MGVNVINCLNTGIFAGNKLFTHMLLKKQGISTPFATVSFSKEAALESLEKHGYPQIIKPTVGSWGRMVSKINDNDSAEGILETRDGMTEEEAVEFFEFNIAGAYVGEYTPIYMYEE